MLKPKLCNTEMVQAILDGVTMPKTAIARIV